jgi:hypothetical protein
MWIVPLIHQAMRTSPVPPATIAGNAWSTPVGADEISNFGAQLTPSRELEKESAPDQNLPYLHSIADTIFPPASSTISNRPALRYCSQQGSPVLLDRYPRWTRRTGWEGGVEVEIELGIKDQIIFHDSGHMDLVIRGSNYSRDLAITSVMSSCCSLLNCWTAPTTAWRRGPTGR